VGSVTALALRDDQTQWDKQQIAVLEAGGIDGDVSEAELASFLHECQRRKLDPFSRQIYLIGRYDRRKGRKVYRSQTSIDGFRLVARRAADKSGIEYSYEDTIWFDDKGGRHEVWLSPGSPAAAKVVVVRNGCRFDAVARFGAYVQTDRDGEPQGLWKNMPDVLIAKCAEALALRKAFPEDLGGIYTEEEMAQADNPQRVQATVEVVRDEPARSGSDEAWLAAATEAAPKHASLEACGAVWRKSAEMVREGKLARAEAGQLQDVLRNRMTELKAAAEQSAESDVVEAEIVEDGNATLDPEDSWGERVADIADEDEAGAVLSELSDGLSSGEITEDRYRQVAAAIEARFPAGNAKAAA
jgi:phage recombination protein Bet